MSHNVVMAGVGKSRVLHSAIPEYCASQVHSEAVVDGVFASRGGNRKWCPGPYCVTCSISFSAIAGCGSPVRVLCQPPRHINFLLSTVSVQHSLLRGSTDEIQITRGSRVLQPLFISRISHHLSGSPEHSVPSLKESRAFHAIRHHSTLVLGFGHHARRRLNGLSPSMPAGETLRSSAD